MKDPIPKETRWKSPKFLKFIRTQKCICGDLQNCFGNIEAHHSGPRTGHMTHDFYTVPVCMGHHIHVQAVPPYSGKPAPPHIHSWQLIVQFYQLANILKYFGDFDGEIQPPKVITMDLLWNDDAKLTLLDINRTALSRAKDLILAM